MSVKGQGNLLHRSTIAIVCLRTGGGASGWERGAGGGGEGGGQKATAFKTTSSKGGEGRDSSCQQSCHIRDLWDRKSTFPGFLRLGCEPGDDGALEAGQRMCTCGSVILVSGASSENPPERRHG